MWIYPPLTAESEKQKCAYFSGTPRGAQSFLFGPTLPLAECKYQFQAWGECDLNTALKTRTGSLKRALHNADCQKTVTISKPCGKLTKPKPQGRSLSSCPTCHRHTLIDSGRILRCGNSDFQKGDLRWITFIERLKTRCIWSVMPVLFSRQLSSNWSPLHRRGVGAGMGTGSQHKSTT